MGTALSCAEGSTCPPVGITRSHKPWAPLRCTQEPVLRCAPAVKALVCLTCGWVVLRTRPLIVAVRGPDPSTHTPVQAHAVAALPYFADPPRALFGVDGPTSTGGPVGASYGGAGRRWLLEHRRTDQATSVVSLATAVIALLSTRKALLMSKRSRAGTWKRKRKARKV